MYWPHTSKNIKDFIYFIGYLEVDELRDTLARADNPKMKYHFALCGLAVIVVSVTYWL